MKTHSGYLSCSCTSCTYRSESDRPSFRRFITQGSRIDRLYYGKYIPLRERKLLERLVRTRGVYDDIRAQLVSDSTISLDKKAVLKPGRKISTKNLDGIEQTRTILELVDQIDKGEKFGSKDLSGCCSCCSCSSKIHHKSASKQRLHRDHPDVYKHGRYNIVDRRKAGVRFKTKHIRSDPCTCTYKFSGMIKKLSKGRRENQPFTFVDLQPTTDEELTQRPKKIKKLARLSYEKLQQSKTRSKEIIMEGIRKSIESNTNIRKKLDLQAKQSIEKLKRVKRNVKDKIKGRKTVKEIKNIDDLRSCKCPRKDLLSQIKKDSRIKFRDDLKKKQIMKNWECEPECIEDICVPEKCFHKLKHKNSLLFKHPQTNDIVIKDFLTAKSVKQPSIKIESMKKTNTTNIQPINETVKQKPILRKQPLHVSKTQPVDDKIPNIQKSFKKRSQKEKEVCQCGSTTSHLGSSVKSITKLPVSNINNKRTKNMHKHQSHTPNHPITIHKKGKYLRTDKETSQRQVVRIGSSFSFNIEFYKNKNVPHKDSSGFILQKSHISSKPSINKKRKEKAIRRHRKGSQVELKQPSRNVKTGENNLKRCFCTFKLKPKKIPKHKKDTLPDKSVSTSKSHNAKYLNVETNTYNSLKNMKQRQKISRNSNYLLPYECEPGVCEPYNCDPYECIKLINMRNKKVIERSVQSGYFPDNVQLFKNKSTTSIKSRSFVPLRNKFVQLKSDNDNKSFQIRKNRGKKIVNKEDSYNNNQVVRIGSSISFNLEFYKNKSPLASKQMSSRRIINEKYLKALKRIDSQTGIDRNSINNIVLKTVGFGNTLKRCFCTLKLKEKRYTKTRKNKKIVTDRDLMKSHIMTHDKSTKTKKGRTLKPYECEPFVCRPGACDPYICLERINQRLKDNGSVTDSPKTKTVSSATFLEKSLKNIYIQSNPKSIASTGSNKSKEYSSSTNQVVKIGSTFSFNIEFYKNNNNKLKKSFNEIKSAPLLDKTKIRKMTKNRGNKINKLNVAHVTTQRKDTKKLNKSSLASNLVKRCFCTLNLQRYRKTRPHTYHLSAPLQNKSMIREYTINRALIDTTLILNNENYYKDLSDIVFNCYNEMSNKYFHMPYQEITSSLYSVSVLKTSKTTLSADYLTSSSYLKQTGVTNLNQYIKNSFCAMNLQLAYKNNSTRKPKSTSVKIGSNFSFDIDFIKKSLPLENKKEGNLSELRSNKNVTKKINKNMKAIGTVNKIVSYNRQSQSGFINVLPNPKKCFCTLKLQKKGKWHTKKHHQTDLSKEKRSSKAMVKSVNKSQNTTFKPTYLAHSLQPYECEPNICTPGKCDPYQCLEIMKRKKINKQDSFRSSNLALSLKPYECEPNICTPGYCDPYQCLEIINRRNQYTKESAVDTIFLPRKSTGSMTRKNNVIKGTQKTYNKNVTKDYTSDLKQSGKTPKSDISKPSKQVVKVGSNFSFNIEFYKERKSPGSSQSAYRDIKKIKRDQDMFIGRPKQYQVESSSHKASVLRHKQTDIKKFPKVASTMTRSFLKRCFCTAQLQKVDQINPKQSAALNVSSPSFLRKCFCLIKSMGTAKHGIHIEKLAHSNKNTETQNKLAKLTNHRAFYECEPGMCIPGECNPYECEKILRKTRMKNSKISTVNKTRSVFTHNSAVVTKNAHIQSKSKSKQTRSELRPSKASFGASDRQAVKIGSNFSFNIEFYKKNDPNYSKSLKSSEIESISSNKNKYKKSKNKKVENDKISTHSQLSQSNATAQKSDRATEGQRFLKRCFCTLQFQNQHAQNPEVKAKINKSRLKLSTKSIMTEKAKPDILKSYQCEPNICVPYECDPYECDKIMKLRKKERYREAGILTGTPKRKSVSTIGSYKGSKKKTQTVEQKNRYRKVNFSNNDKQSLPVRKVKIGSSFNFDVEFFKNSNGSKLKEILKQTDNKSNENKIKVSPRTKQAQASKIKAETASSQTKKVKVTPTLKRCFCTLIFKKSKKKPKPLKSFTSNVGTETQKLPESTDLLPYECEPQVCVPGECDPYQCLERIKRRNLINSGSNTVFSETKNMSSMADTRARLQTKKSQMKTHHRQEIYHPRSRERSFKNRNKQAVRIGSNFNFNIEFYKNKNDAYNESQQRHNNNSLKSPKQKINKKQNKECDDTNCPEIKDYQRVKIQDKRVKLKTKKTDNAKNAGNFIKKCFCVFKLHKLRKKEQSTAPVPKLKQNINKDYVTSQAHQKSIAVERKLLPYECEPNVCVPEKCDPYECEKRIKRRLLNNSNTETKSVVTDYRKSKSIKLQGSKIKLKDRRLNTKSHRDKNLKKSIHRNKLTSDSNKQVVRVGSTFSFDIEFYRNRKQEIHRQNSQNEKSKKAIPSRYKNISIANKTMVSRGSKAYKCDPIKCEKKINTTQNKIKSYNMNTQVIRQCADECVGIMAKSFKTKNRSSVTNSVITLPQGYKKKAIAEIPQSNRQAVKIGSNFSFNIEFSKGVISQKKSFNNLKYKKPKVIQEKSPESTAKYVDNKIINTKSAITHNHRSQAIVKTEEKSLDVHNALNRCFCTLKLQKNIRPTKIKKNVLTPYSKIPPFPQTIEVRRVKVQNNKSTSKNYASVRTVATKINKKYTTEKKCLNSPCKCSLCKNMLHINSNEMETILPYKATKFEKSPSKTLLLLHNKPSTKNKMKGIKTANATNGKKLNKKKSQRNIFIKKERFNFKSFLCRCAAAFKSEHTRNNISIKMKTDEPLKQKRSGNMSVNRLKVSKSDRRPLLPTNSQLRPSKSFKLDCRYCNDCILRNKYENKGKNKNLKEKIHQGIKKKNTKTRESESNAIDQMEEPKNLHEILSKKNIKKYRNSKKLSSYNECCYSCGRKFVEAEIKQGAGDRTVDNRQKQPKIRKNGKLVIDKEEDKKGCKGECKQKPFFELQLNTNDYDILNKAEVKDNVTKYTLKNELGENKKKNLKVKAKGNRNENNKSEGKIHAQSSQAFDHVFEGEGLNQNNKFLKKLKNEQNYNELCDHCRENINKKSRQHKRISSTLRVHFMDTTSKGKSVDNTITKTQKTSKEKSKNTLKTQKTLKGKSLDPSLTKQNTLKSKRSVTGSSKPCCCCGNKFVKKDIEKGAGEHISKDSLYQSSINKLKEIFKLNNDTDNVCSGNNKPKPLFEMHLNSNDYDIINKEQFMDNVSKYSTRSKTDRPVKEHKKSCRCCICLSKRNKTGAHIHVSPKGSKMSRSFRKVFNTSTSQSPAVLTNKPCTCGSFICSKNVKKLRESSKLGKPFYKQHSKPCVCGSPICDRESAAMNALSTSPDKVTCTCQEIYAKKERKLKMIKHKAEAKHYAARLKLLNKEDSNRRRKRIKEDKHLEKRINKKSSDVVLLAESAIDIGKLGITACVDILRSVARTAADPKHAYFTLKAMKDDPQLMARHLKTAFGDSGVAATAKRVRLRCLAMRGVKKIKSTLEKYAITNYLLHIADDDPRSRLVKKKKRPERVRERLDFGCSLYMASLRKRPYLSIYDRCPWFYPHFLSLVNVWKQFADITLFLLAVVVWSPCILCMELCRAMMCCLFCTG